MKTLIATAVLLFAASDAFAARGFSKTQDFREATPEELALTDVAGSPGAPAVILDWVRIDDDNLSTTAEYVRLKVLTDEGKRYGDVEIPYFPVYPYKERVTDLSARTIRPDGTVVPFTGEVYDKVLMKVGRRAVRAKTFSMPDVQAGSIIEYRFMQRRSKQLLTNTHWPVQREIPIARATLSLIPYTRGDFSSFFSYIGLPPGVKPVRTGDRYDIPLRDLPAARTEPYMPPQRELFAQVNFVYTTSRVRIADFWSVQAAVFAKEIEQFLGGRAPRVADLAKSLALEHPSDRMALLKAIYAHAQSLRNTSYAAQQSADEADREEFGAASNANEVLTRGAGSATEINSTFVAVARAAGFDADVLRVAPRDERFFSDKVPNADQMNAELALVVVDGRKLYLDPGTPFAPFGIVSWEKSNVPSIHISKGKPPVFVLVPAQEADRAIVRRSADLRLNGETLEGTIRVAFTGQEALVRRLAHVEDEAARRKAIEDEVKAWFPGGATLKPGATTGLADSSDELVATFDVTLPNIASRAGSRTIVPLSVFEATAKNPFAATSRTHPIYFQWPFQEEDEVRLAVPAGTTVSLPQATDLTIGSATFRAEAKQEGESVTFRRTQTSSAMLVEVKFYDTVRKFHGAVVAADQQPAVFAPNAAAQAGGSR